MSEQSVIHDPRTGSTTQVRPVSGTAPVIVDGIEHTATAATEIAFAIYMHDRPGRTDVMRRQLQRTLREYLPGRTLAQTLNDARRVRSAARRAGIEYLTSA